IHPRDRWRRDQPPRRPAARETPLDDRTGKGDMSAISRRERAAWGFVAPALIAIGIFFVIPVVSALLLSLTDFDIYALADLGNLRFVGLQNYERLLTNPLFWQAMKNTVWFS